VSFRLALSILEDVDEQDALLAQLRAACTRYVCMFIHNDLNGGIVAYGNASMYHTSAFDAYANNNPMSFPPHTHTYTRTHIPTIATRLN